MYRVGLMNDERLQESDAAVTLVGHDKEGRPFELPVGPDDDPVEIEAKVREVGGRISLARLTKPDRPLPPGTAAEDFARFNEMLASAVRKGIPLLDGIRDLSRKVRSHRFRASLDRVKANLERGETLEQAFAPESTDFPRLYGRLLSAGATAGNLCGVLLAHCRNIRCDAAFRRGVVEACVYPVFLFGMCCAFLSGFAFTMFPIFSETARIVEMEMPTLTMIMTGQSDTARLVFWLLALGVAAVLILWFAVLRNIQVGRDLREVVMLRTPFFRRLHEAAVWSAASDTLALLVRAGVPAPLAYRLVGAASGSRWLARSFEEMAADIVEGAPLSKAARNTAGVPLRFARACDAGEIGGDLAGSLEALAREYRTRAERHAHMFLRYLPLALALMFGVAVLVIALTVLWPYIRFWGAAW